MVSLPICSLINLINFVPKSEQEILLTEIDLLNMVVLVTHLKLQALQIMIVYLMM